MTPPETPIRSPKRPVHIRSGPAVGAAIGGAARYRLRGSRHGDGVSRWPIGTAVAQWWTAVGGLVGKGVAESVNPTLEDEYWRKNYSTRPYVSAGETYEEYGRA